MVGYTVKTNPESIPMGVCADAEVGYPLRLNRVYIRLSRGLSIYLSGS